MKKNLVKSMSVALLMGGVMAFAACSSDDESVKNYERHDIPVTRTDMTLVNKNNDFAFRLLREMQDGQSKILSPLGITFALGMLNNGATGETQEQISQTLGFGDTSIEDINAFCRKLLTEAPTLDGNVEVKVANNVFIDKRYHLNSDFSQVAQDYYDASPMTCDFSKPANALSAINGWVKDHTKGKIAQPVSSLSPDVVSLILSATYFNGIWKDKFEKGNTKLAAFYEGNNYAVQMMHRKDKYDYAESEDLQVLRMPYGNEAFAMTVLLPREGKGLNDILAVLDGDEMAEIHAAMRQAQVDVKVPTFETSSDIDLCSVMAKLGMPKAFTLQAEFPNFCDAAAFISEMNQHSSIRVDEEGTEVITVTDVRFPDGEYIPATEAVFIADHPFVYVISEKSTGAIFFIGSYFGD